MIITSLGAREDINAAVHSWGGIVMHDVINNRFAKKAIEKGADGLIPVAAGAGGHAGTLSPFALMQEIREWFDGPLALSGAIATGGSWPPRRWAPTSPISAAPSSPPRKPARRGYKQASSKAAAEGHRLFQPVHRRARQLPAPSIVKAGLDPDNLPKAILRQDELRQRRQHRSQGVEGHLGLGPGHRRGQGWNRWPTGLTDWKRNTTRPAPNWPPRRG
jgi:nitronate monooxygenase